LAHPVDPLGKISSNPCEGIKQLYTVDRSEKIWTDADITRQKGVWSPEIADAVDLAAHTGLRQGDLLKLSWSHIGEHEIIIATGKSRGRREAIIPLYPDLRNVLARIPKRSTTILTNRRGRPWGKGFASSFSRAKKLAGLDELHFHDLRGTAATRFYTAGLSERVIAEIMGWEEEHVGKIIRRYVGRAAATRATIRQLERRT
jgi:integrase